jgi:hypothetical protein
MNAIQTPRRGLVLACLLLSLTSCANKPQNVRTETVEVAVPVIVGVPDALTEVPAEPVLPAGELTNADVADHLDALRAWGRGLAGKLREIAGLDVDE